MYLNQPEAPQIKDIMTILFVTYGGGHVQMVAPVIRQLQRIRPELRVECLALTTAQPVLRAMEIPFRTMSEFLALFPAEAREWGEELAVERHNDGVGIAYEESVAYLGLSFWDLVETHGEPRARALLAEKGTQAFLQRRVAARIIDELKPTVIATTNSPRMEHASVLEGKAASIPTLTMVDLFGRFNFCPIVADHVSVFSPKTRTNLVEAGLMAEATECHFFGNPSFDKYLEVQPSNAGDGENRDPALLFLDMPAFLDFDRDVIHTRTANDVVQDLDDLSAACAAQDLDLMIRPHPSQDRGPYERWIAGSEHGHRTRIVAGGPLEPVLRQVRLVIARSSTSLLEAVFCGCRTLQINYQKTDNIELPLAQMGLSWPVRHRSELAETVARALSDDVTAEAHWQRRLETLPTEPAAPRIAAFLASLAGSSD